MNFCPNCGQQLAEDTRFCPKCGKTVQQEAPTEEPAATNPQPTPEQAPQDATAAPQAQFPQESNTSPATPEQAPQRPPKKKKKVLFIIAGVLVGLIALFVIIGNLGNSSSATGGQTLEIRDKAGTLISLKHIPKKSNENFNVWLYDTGDGQTIEVATEAQIAPEDKRVYVYLYSNTVHGVISWFLNTGDNNYGEWVRLAATMDKSFGNTATLVSIDEACLPTYQISGKEYTASELLEVSAYLLAHPTDPNEFALLASTLKQKANETFAAIVLIQSCVFDLANPGTPDTSTAPATQNAAGDAKVVDVFNNPYVVTMTPIPSDKSDDYKYAVWNGEKFEVPLEIDKWTKEQTSFWCGVATAIEVELYGGFGWGDPDDPEPTAEERRLEEITFEGMDVGRMFIEDIKKWDWSDNQTTEEVLRDIVKGIFPNANFRVPEIWVAYDTWYTEQAAADNDNAENSGAMYQTNTEQGSDLRIRSSPSTDADILGNIPHQTIVEISRISDGWGYVTYGGASGWVSMEYLVYLDEIYEQSPAVSQPQATAPATQKSHTVYTVTALEGCVIIEQPSGTSSFKYKTKCPYCGKVGNSTITHAAQSSGESKSSATCSNSQCGNWGKSFSVRIKYSSQRVSG